LFNDGQNPVETWIKSFGAYTAGSNGLDDPPLVGLHIN
jgi:hypothetical protein